MTRAKRYRLRHPDRARNSHRRWRANNLEKAREAYRLWYSRNREDALKARRSRYAKNRDKMKIQRRIWYVLNRNKVLARLRQRYREEPLYRERHLDRHKCYRDKDSSRFRAGRRAYCRRNRNKYQDYANKRRAKLLGAGAEDCSAKISTLLKEKLCHWCNAALSNFNRSIDHVIPLALGGTHIPDNLVASCRSCNCRKNARMPDEWSSEINKLFAMEGAL